jgi:hypothetical protein
MTDTNELIRAAATHARAVAQSARGAGWVEPTTIDADADDLEGERLIVGAGWSFYAGHNLGTPATYVGDMECEEFAQQVALWTPAATSAAADLLESIADPGVGAPPAVQQYALRLAELLNAAVPANGRAE